MTDGPLCGYRALDLTDEKGLLCGKILADLGVEVIKVEPPGGDEARNIPPFYGDVPDPEKSLFYFAHNSTKKSITLDIATSDGQAIFKKLVKDGDFVLESFEPGRMPGIGLGYKELSRINPRIIVTSITPFGQTGPYRSFKGANIVCAAMSGYMYSTGDSDRAPVAISLPLAYSIGGAEASTATLIAHYYRERTGEGQHVDVSLREAMSKVLQQAIEYWQDQQRVLTRTGPYRTGLSTTARQRTVWRCKDGWVSFVVFGARFGARSNRKLVEWMDSEGLSNDFLNNMDWDSFDMSKSDQDFHDGMEEVIARFFSSHTKDEISRGAMERGIMLHPVNTMEDIVKSPQLEARDFFVDVEHPELGAIIRYPGPFVKASLTACVKPVRAPLIGEHNEEIYLGELGFSKEQLAILKAGKVI